MKLTSLFKKTKTWDELVQEFTTSKNMKKSMRAGGEIQEMANEGNIQELYGLLTYDKTAVDYFSSFVSEPLIRLEGVKALPKLLEALYIGTKNSDDCDTLQTIIIGLVKSNSEDCKIEIEKMDYKKHKEEIDWISEFLE